VQPRARHGCAAAASPSSDLRVTPQARAETCPAACLLQCRRSAKSVHGSRFVYSACWRCCAERLFAATESHLLPCGFSRIRQLVATGNGAARWFELLLGDLHRVVSRRAARMTMTSAALAPVGEATFAKPLSADVDGTPELAPRSSLMASL